MWLCCAKMAEWIELLYWVEMLGVFDEFQIPYGKGEVLM